MRQAVLSADRRLERGGSRLEVAKRLLDYGSHAPTMYFPPIVHAALMIEPTESETKETPEAFIAALRAIDAAATTEPALAPPAPHTTPAARRPMLRWQPAAD